jgi:lysozyme
MKCSDVGLDLIKQFEGFRAIPYKDVKGLLTIGWGHLIKPGEVFGALSSVEATAILSRDVQEAQDCINFYVKVALTQNQFDALCSFVFNLGCANFHNSTLCKYCNSGDYNAAAEEFPKWCFAGKVKVEGLLKRRLAEQELFNK